MIVFFFVASKKAGMDRAFLLMGATATGKTDLAVSLVQEFPVEIISVDSALIYRGMDIGTAKPDATTLESAPHHLIDIIDPAQRWSVWDFVSQATLLIREMNQRGRIPLLVGGTMMYFNALEQGLNKLPVADEGLRRDLKQRLQQEGIGALYQSLSEVDPAMAQRLKATDSQRILRALEVYQISGKPMSELLLVSNEKPDIDFKRMIMDVSDRAALHRRIKQRFTQMMEAGFEQEVRHFYGRGDLDPEMPSMRCVGYRQMWSYLEGNYDYHQMVDKSIIATRQLAKRQLTWLRKYKTAKRLDYLQYSRDEAFTFFEKAIDT